MARWRALATSALAWRHDAVVLDLSSSTRLRLDLVRQGLGVGDDLAGLLTRLVEHRERARRPAASAAARASSAAARAVRILSWRASIAAFSIGRAYLVTTQQDDDDDRELDEPRPVGEEEDGACTHVG